MREWTIIDTFGITYTYLNHSVEAAWARHMRVVGTRPREIY
jgi:hypothetical protein